MSKVERWPDHGQRECPTCNYVDDAWIRDWLAKGHHCLTLVDNGFQSPVHHIFGGKTRHDVDENRVQICQGCHDNWFHHAARYVDKRSATVCLLHWEAMHGRMSRDRQEVLAECQGVDSLSGWVQSAALEIKGAAMRVYPVLLDLLKRPIGHDAAGGEPLLSFVFDGERYDACGHKLSREVIYDD